MNRVMFPLLDAKILLGILLPNARVQNRMIQMLVAYGAILKMSDDNMMIGSKETCFFG